MIYCTIADFHAYFKNDNRDVTIIDRPTTQLRDGDILSVSLSNEPNAELEGCKSANAKLHADLEKCNRACTMNLAMGEYYKFRVDELTTAYKKFSAQKIDAEELYKVIRDITGFPTGAKGPIPFTTLYKDPEKLLLDSLKKLEVIEQCLTNWQSDEERIKKIRALLQIKH